MPLGLQLVPGALLCAGMLICPESPRWLARKDRWEEAEKVLLYLRNLPSDHPYIRDELSDIRQQVEQHTANKMTYPKMFKRLIQKGVRNRILIGLLLMACQNLTGVNIITYCKLHQPSVAHIPPTHRIADAPRIFETLGITGTSTKLFATGFYGIAKTLGMVIFSVWLVERVGRRKGLIWGAFVGSLPMWYIGGYVMKADPATAAAAGQTQRDGWGYLAMGK